MPTPERSVGRRSHDCYAFGLRLSTPIRLRAVSAGPHLNGVRATDLDEVDAAMDEGNINRFIRVLDRFVEQSQFIIITHNKRTIAKADVLYGVTMEERGVSKLVGMKLTAPGHVSTEVTSNGGEQNPTQRRLALAMR